jgi:hypothetical protein
MIPKISVKDSPRFPNPERPLSLFLEGPFSGLI